jgi:thymidine kinase
VDMSLLLHVFTGPMWSGKTSALIQHFNHSNFHPSVPRTILKHVIDTRGPSSSIVARTGEVLRGARAVASLDGVDAVPGHLYAIDEAQFFGDGLVSFWDRLAHAHVDWAANAHSQGRFPPATGLFVAGLDLDYARKEFGSVMRLCRTVIGSCSDGGSSCLHTASGLSVDFGFTRMTARCSYRSACGTVCNHPACYSQRLAEGGDAQVQVGGAQFYQPACPRHHSCAPLPLHAWDPTHSVSAKDAV